MTRRIVASVGVAVIGMGLGIGAQQPAPVPPAPAAAATFMAGSTVFIEEMDGDLDGYLRAELMKKKVPITVVLDETTADFIMTGSGSQRKSSWTEGWITPRQDNATGAVAVIAKSTKAMVWAEEAGDRSLMWGALARGGPRKVASRIADRLKDHLKKAR